MSDEHDPAVGRLHPEPHQEKRLSPRDRARKALTILLHETGTATISLSGITVADVNVDLETLVADAIADAEAELLRAAGEIAPPAPPWQPIETAPRNGTRIVGWCQNPSYRENGGHARVVWSRGKRWLSKPGGWTSHVTHWMPLPPVPPQAPEQE